MPARIPSLVICFCLISGQGLFCQKIDSLKRVLVGQRGSDRFGILYDLVFEYISDENFDQALHLIEDAQSVALGDDDSLHIVKAGRVKGQVLRRLDRISEAICEFQKVILIAKRNDFETEYEYILNGLALSYSFQGSYDNALKFHLECLVLREGKQDFEGICVTLTNIGLVYYKLGDNEKALEYYGRALKTEPVCFKNQLLINIGLCHNSKQDYLTGLKFIQEGIKLCGSTCNSTIIIQGEHGIGESLFKIGRSIQAENHFKKSYEMAKRIKDRRLQIDNLYYLAKIKVNSGQFDLGRKLIDEAEAVGVKTEYKESLINVYAEGYHLFLRLKDYENASRYQSKFIAISDSIYNARLMRNLMRIQSEYLERENLATIATQQQILALKEAAIYRQWLLNVLMSAVILLFFGLVLLLIKAYRNKQKNNLFLDRKVAERTRSLEYTLNSLHRSNADLDAFITETSRGIQRPLKSIEGLSSIMRADSDDPRATRENVKYLEKILSSLAELQGKLSVLRNSRS